jgi:phage shock protein PspC (stress-responsive transcriptional regulator)
MTTEQPTSPRLLRRRSDDRVIGGVASGLGEFLNVDPLLVRIGFVGLMVFGGLGLLLYVGGWLLVPDESSDESIVEELLNRTGLTPGRWLILLLFATGTLIFLGGLGNAVAFSDLAVGVGVGIMIIVLGGALLAQSGRLPAFGIGGVPAAPKRPAKTVAAPVEVARPRVARRRRPRSPLGWYVLGATLAGIGLLALATNVSGVDVDLGQFFGLALGVIGIGLVIGTWWGHARLLILLGLLLVPFAITASFITAPIEGGLGVHRFNPTSPQEVRAEYRLVGGRMVIDLTEMRASAAPIHITASVAAGQMRVILPADASIELASQVGAGELGVLGGWQYGSSLEDAYVGGGAGSTFVLDLEMGIGSIRVDAVGVPDR